MGSKSFGFTKGVHRSPCASVGWFPNLREDPKSRSPNSGLQYFYGVEDYGTLRWIFFFDPLGGLGR